MLGLFKRKEKHFDAYIVTYDSDNEQVIEYIAENVKAKSKRDLEVKLKRGNPKLKLKKIFINESINV